MVMDILHNFYSSVDLGKVLLSLYGREDDTLLLKLYVCSLKVVFYDIYLPLGGKDRGSFNMEIR